MNARTRATCFRSGWVRIQTFVSSAGSGGASWTNSGRTSASGHSSSPTPTPWWTIRATHRDIRLVPGQAQEAVVHDDLDLHARMLRAEASDQRHLHAMQQRVGGGEPDHALDLHVLSHHVALRSVVITNTVFASDYRWHLFGRLCRPPVVGELVQALTSRRGFTRDLLRASRKLRREQIHRTYALITPSVKRMMLRWYRAANPRNFAGCGLRQFMHPIPRHRPGFCHRCLSLQASGSRSSHHSAATAKDRSQGSRWAMSNVPDSNICIISA